MLYCVFEKDNLNPKQFEATNPTDALDKYLGKKKKDSIVFVKVSQAEANFCVMLVGGKKSTKNYYKVVNGPDAIKRLDTLCNEKTITSFEDLFTVEDKSVDRIVLKVNVPNNAISAKYGVPISYDYVVVEKDKLGRCRFNVIHKDGTSQTVSLGYGGSTTCISSSWSDLLKEIQIVAKSRGL